LCCTEKPGFTASAFTSKVELSGYDRGIGRAASVRGKGLIECSLEFLLFHRGKGSAKLTLLDA
jgi:hypothetical protein